jgi:hypothetical protein
MCSISFTWYTAKRLGEYESVVEGNAKGFGGKVELGEPAKERKVHRQWPSWVATGFGRFIVLIGSWQREFCSGGYLAVFGSDTADSVRRHGDPSAILWHAQPPRYTSQWRRSLDIRLRARRDLILGILIDSMLS